ncbi:MAG: hypothetical protein RBR16_13890 [Syntrophus sp. (in: bacteria)]|nr:hypothetical protein [Syntrophus sp. (in: bacteria)]
MDLAEQILNGPGRVICTGFGIERANISENQCLINQAKGEAGQSKYFVCLTCEKGREIRAGHPEFEAPRLTSLAEVWNAPTEEVMKTKEAKAMEATPAVKRAERKKGTGYVRKRYGKYLLEIDGECVKSNGDVLKFEAEAEAEAVLMKLLAAPEPGRQDPEPPEKSTDQSTDQSTEPPPPEPHKPSQESPASPEKERENDRLCYFEGCNEPVHGRSNRCLKHCQERVRVIQAKNPKRIEAMRIAQTKAQALYREWKAGNICTRDEALDRVFAADPQLLQRIREQAEKELRTVENQIVFMLRGCE